MMSDPATPAPTASPTLADRVRKDVETLGRELAEIELLVQQAKVEAGRHETKRAQASERLETLTKQIPSADPKEIAEQGASLANLTRRAVLMEAQVEVLEGKAKVLTRFRDSVAEVRLQSGRLLGAPLAGFVLYPCGANADFDFTRRHRWIRRTTRKQESA